MTQVWFTITQISKCDIYRYRIKNENYIIISINAEKNI